MTKKKNTGKLYAKSGLLMTYEEKKKLVARFNLTSDIFFSKVIEDQGACEEVLHILTGKSIKIRSIKSQYSIRNLETRSVILDVLAETRRGRLINIEMQTGENENHLKRSRYHQACIDVSMLEKGTPFDKLPELYSIFITKKDFFNLGKGIYHVERTLREGELTIDNGIHEIYVNLQGEVKNPVLRSLLDYINDSNPDYENPHFPNLIKRVQFYKKEQEGLDYMCEIMDAIREGGVEAGLEAGMEIGKAEGLETGIRSLICTLHEINANDSFIIAKLKEHFHLSQANAQKALQRYS